MDYPAVPTHKQTNNLKVNKDKYIRNRGILLFLSLFYKGGLLDLCFSRLPSGHLKSVISEDPEALSLLPYICKLGKEQYQQLRIHPLLHKRITAQYYLLFCYWVIGPMQVKGSKYPSIHTNWKCNDKQEINDLNIFFYKVLSE